MDTRYVHRCGHDKVYDKNWEDHVHSKSHQACGWQILDVLFNEEKKRKPIIKARLSVLQYFDLFRFPFHVLVTPVTRFHSRQEEQTPVVKRDRLYWFVACHSDIKVLNIQFPSYKSCKSHLSFSLLCDKNNSRLKLHLAYLPNFFPIWTRVLNHNRYVEIKQFSKIDIKENNISTVIKFLVYQWDPRHLQGSRVVYIFIYTSYSCSI